MNHDRLRVFYFNRWQHTDGLEKIRSAREIDLQFLRLDMPPEEIWPCIESAHGYQIGAARDELPEAFQCNDGFLDRCPKLLAVISNGAGYDTVDVAACTARGVAVFNQAGGNREAVAEHTLAMLLCLAKRIVESDRLLRRERGWHRNDLIGRDLTGKTIGIVGIGNIGSRVSQLCASLFGMRVLAFDPYLSAAEIRARGAEPADFDTLVAESDFVSLHCPRNAGTLGMFAAGQFAMMQPSACFISTARGGIHDEAALAKALGEKQIAGAGLDVWDTEPPPLDHPLLQFDNTIVTPHTAGVTDDARRTVALGAVDQWLALARGEQPPRLVNPEVWPQVQERYRRIIGQGPGA